MKLDDFTAVQQPPDGAFDRIWLTYGTNVRQQAATEMNQVQALSRALLALASADRTGNAVAAQQAQAEYFMAAQDEPLIRSTDQGLNALNGQLGLPAACSPTS